MKKYGCQMWTDKCNDHKCICMLQVHTTLKFELATTKTLDCTTVCRHTYTWAYIQMTINNSMGGIQQS